MRGQVGHQQVLRSLHRLEDGLLAALLAALLLVSVAQIGLRVFFDSGLLWAESVSRLGVLWLALLGALGAARERKHIGIDALSRLLPPRWHRVQWCVTQLAAASVCAMLAWVGWGMVGLEREAPALIAGRVPSWWPMLVFPAGFALLGLRLGITAFGEPPEAGA